MSENLELKEKFFVHYWGQKVLKITSTKIEEVGSHWNLKHPSFKLLLKPLSALSNEDYEFLVCNIVEISKTDFNRFNSKENKQKIIEVTSRFTATDQRAVDYLRSKGYAVPFMQYSIEELIKMGWVELLS